MIDKENDVKEFRSFMNSDYLHQKVESEEQFRHGTDWYQV